MKKIMFERQANRFKQEKQVVMMETQQHQEKQEQRHAVRDVAHGH